MKKTFICRSPDETARAAQEIAAFIRGREVIAFFGPLGAGKTTFIRYLCRALGVEDEVTSPTFAMVHEYNGPFPVYHFDMYRVDGPDALFSTGYEDYLGSGLLLIEWSEHIEEALPPDAWRIYLAYGPEENTREITLERANG
ncbi:MAG: tRNA (adenosine(37)-N6)-threonylcarbamoyltransferase complex ATPase subunit type 1 TsaE [Clostridiales bacterium]|nr:MAG: tRNA (adenosine(37)-N6)-threonylcarbamoyltransferase complex ATPase subunit type 1 TsaE [Clostridiales bacterium]